MPSPSPENRSDSEIAVSSVGTTKRTTRRRFALTISISLIVIVLIGALAVFLYGFPGKSAFPPLPEPNGYDVFVRAAAKIIRSDKTVTEMTANELADFVATNQVALTELRLGLKLPSAVPVKMDETWIASQTTELMNLKAAGTAMNAEAFFLHQQGDHSAALNRSLELAHYGQAFSKGGVLINCLVGSACEVMAVRRITNMLSSLNPADCMRAARALQQYERNRESFDDIRRREAEWSRRTFGVFARVREMIETRSLRPDEGWGLMFADDNYETRTREIRLVMLKVAARGFEIKYGRRPQRASDLVPEFLSAVPLDPASQKPLELP